VAGSLVYFAAMKLLFLAPQPFFQERGTPIAVRLALEVLTTRAGRTEIDLVTYHEGRDVPIPGVHNHRIRAPRWLRNIGPGISVKKLLCDLLFLLTVIRLVWRARREPYDLVHAVEESVFIALLLKVVIGVPYVYDMDSSLALQVAEKWWALAWCRPVLQQLEAMAIKGSVGVVPVCDALAAIADAHGSPRTFVLRDVSLLDFESDEPSPIDLREELCIPPSGIVVLYVGNLERYQGVALLVDAFEVITERYPDLHLVVIGGVAADVERCRARKLRSPHLVRAHFLGARPVAHLSRYMSQGDIVASPRLLGNNTPMKIYSYLHSGKAILATKIESHTQVLDGTVAELCDPTVEGMAAGLRRLVTDPDHRAALGRAAQERAERLYTFAVFRQRLTETYDRILEAVPPRGASRPPPLPEEPLTESVGLGDPPRPKGGC
jgi:glycosyltransferase involved in cell wall biosynthesis